jgi:hypothetical protein
MTRWRALLLVHDRLDVQVLVGRRPTRFAHRLGAAEIDHALASFRRLPALVNELSEGEAALAFEVVTAGRTLDSLTGMGDEVYWPSPDDTRPGLTRHSPPGANDSVFVLWPQNDLTSGAGVPSGGWGLALGASEWTGGVTYATVANAAAWAWAEPVPGEVWLHEWLHGVCDHYARRGFPMPPGDADGAERHGYRRPAEAGWSPYYRDLMTGRVTVAGRQMGITADAWRSGSPALRHRRG